MSNGFGISGGASPLEEFSMGSPPKQIRINQNGLFQVGYRIEKSIYLSLLLVYLSIHLFLATYLLKLPDYLINFLLIYLDMFRMLIGTYLKVNQATTHLIFYIYLSL